MRTEYEILLMLDPELPEERQDEIVERARELVEKRRRHAGTATSRGAGASSRTRSRTRTTASTTCSSSTPSRTTLDELSRILKITDGVMRHLAVRRVQRSPGAAGSAAAA